MNFSNSFEKRAQPLPIKREDYKRNKELETQMSSEDPRFYIVVDSILAVKTYNDLSDLFNNLQFFLISRELSELKELMTRTVYRGSFKIDTEREFSIRLKNAFGDKSKDLDIDKFLDLSMFQENDIQYINDHFIIKYFDTRKDFGRADDFMMCFIRK